MKLYSHLAAGWHIRPFQRGDLVQMESLFLDCLTDFPWRGPATEEIVRLRRAISGGAACLVTEEPQAGVVGFLTLERSKAYVAHLFVDRDWRLCGIASGLLDVARDLARSPLQLDVDLQNEDALRAYKKLGWTEKVGATTARPEQRRLASP